MASPVAVWRTLPDLMEPWDPRGWWPLEVTQRHFHQPGDDVPGDCFRCCIAAVLRHEREEVPHFLRYSAVPGEDRDDLDPDGLWWWAAHGYLGAHGLWYQRHDLDGITKANPTGFTELLWASTAAPGPVIVVGRSPRGFEHVVVAYRGELAWDPHPSRDGLVEAWAFESFLTIPENNRWRAGA